MKKSRLTLHKSLAVTILIIGIIGIILVISTDFTYRKLAYEQQKESVSQLVAIKSADLIKKLSDRQKELGFGLQNEDGFKNAFSSGKANDIVYWLDQEFNRYFVTLGLIKLEKILIYDDQFQLVSRSTRGFEIASSSNLPCAQTIKYVNTLPAIQRTKPISQLCMHNNIPLLNTVVSIGSIKARGYIQIISDPAHILTQIETELGIPLKIYNSIGGLLHQSGKWPHKNKKIDNLVSHYDILDADGNLSMKVSVASDISVFRGHLDNTRYKIILGSSLLTLLTLLVALGILHRGLQPLTNLRRAADSSARGEFISVNESGYDEISSPIHAFNMMVGKIKTLIRELTDEVNGHKQTEQKFKLAKEHAEKQTKLAQQQSYFFHMTLQSIVDGVITTDINGYIRTINPMAEQLTGWSEQDAEGKPLVQVMHALDEDTDARIYDPTENIEYKTVLDEPVSAVLIQNRSNIRTPVEYIAAPMRDEDDEIAGIVIIIHDESVQRSLNRQLTFQATHDALTGLINRYEFERRLKNVISILTSSSW
jgi:PAS domain S-box-containing protein